MPEHCHIIPLAFPSVWAGLKRRSKNLCACVLDDDRHQIEKALDLLLDVLMPRSSAG